MNTLALFFVICSALIDVAANMMVAKSEGFRRWRWGVGAIVLVWIAFALLGQAVRYMDLATAYAMWGAIGVIGTASCGRLLFGNRLRPIGWIGIALVTARYCCSAPPSSSTSGRERGGDDAAICEVAHAHRHCGFPHGVPACSATSP
ncbi:hypothetical protein C7E18_08175 [Stenotrophomonas maltophilia]|nr:hypothetical protein C7E18_08175 [Stenotrophomonas maltophilia]